jgi:hypothetical protein
MTLGVSVGFLMILPLTEWAEDVEIDLLSCDLPNDDVPGYEDLLPDKPTLRRMPASFPDLTMQTSI